MSHKSFFSLMTLLLFVAFTTEIRESHAAANVAPWKGELPIRDAWLRERLPDDAMVYLRIPHFMGLLATPKGNALDSALRGRTNVENVQKVHIGLIENLLPTFPAFDDAKFRLLASSVRSPIEVALRFAPAPGALISANLAFADPSDLEKELSAAGLMLAEPLADSGIAEIVGLPMPAFLRFDQASGQLLINIGAGVNREVFEETLATLKKERVHRIRNAEARIDESGHGFFVWIDAENAMGPIRLMVPEEQLAPLVDLGIDHVATAAFGWGVAGGKSRMAVVADLKADDDRGFIPLVRNRFGAKSVGAPDGLITLSIPTADEYVRLEQLILKTVSEESAAEWPEMKAVIADFLGVSIEELLSAIGPEIAFIFDQSGDYSAVRLRNPRVWEDFAATIAERTGSDPKGVKRGRKTYYHWAIPSFPDVGDEESEELEWYLELLTRPKDHAYWTRDGDYLYFASVPQILFDRSAAKTRTNVGEWLDETQSISSDSAFLTMSASTEKLPQRLYAFYIEMLQGAADLGETDIDVWNMPTAAELNLPRTGTIGFSVELGDPTLAAVLTFENNPLEMIGGAGASSVAIAGILAAIAVPAYQDYTVRAKVSQGLIMGGQLKAAISEHHATNGRFPDSEEAAQLTMDEVFGGPVESLTVEADTGAIVIEYNYAVGNGGALMLVPVAEDDGSLYWNCSGTMAEKFLPSSCR